VTCALRRAKLSDPKDPVAVDRTIYSRGQGGGLECLRAALAVYNDTTTDTQTITQTAGLTSTTIQSSGLKEGKCVHPLLVISPGCTHRMGAADSVATHRKELEKCTVIMICCD
jgi:hypothetical protein